MQVALDAAIQKRLKMITRQLGEVRSVEAEAQLARKQLDTFDRLYSAASCTQLHHNILEKDFECPVCYEVSIVQQSFIIHDPINQKIFIIVIPR